MIIDIKVPRCGYCEGCHELFRWRVRQYKGDRGHVPILQACPNKYHDLNRDTLLMPCYELWSRKPTEEPPYKLLVSRYCNHCDSRFACLTGEYDERWWWPMVRPETPSGGGRVGAA